MKLFAPLRQALFASMAVLLGLPVQAQVPDQCLEIESILVDACIDLDACPGASEGQNEMVRFRTGAVAIALSELEADWPNNSWNGLVQDAGTAALTDALNATIQGCGWLVEPPQGIIPPGSQVLLITSTQMCTAANSFANLSDTLHIIFQAPGNTSGHFANHTNGGTVSPVPTGTSSLRTLVLTYLPSGCSDTVVYDRSLLTNSQGTYGGPSALNDGATAVFSWPGEAQATYVNYGCQAPFEPILVSVEEANGSLCNGTGSVQLTGAVSEAVASVLWQGGSGTFSDPASLITTYTAGPSDIGPVTIQLCAIGNCGAPICVDYTLPSGTGPTVTIDPSGPLDICPGQSLTLTASGADSYLWSTQEATAAVTITQPGTYSVTGTDACGTGTAQVEVAAGALPEVTIAADGPAALCPGQTLTLTASGADAYVWSTAAATPAITVDQPGTYSVTGTNGCGEGQASITIAEGTEPLVIIALDGPSALCPGQSVTLIASGADSFAWSTSELTPSIVVTQPGTYSVTGTNACGTGSAQVEIGAGIGPTVSISLDGPSVICPGQSVTLTATGADGYLWSTLATTASITVDQPGTYTVTGTNGCGTDDASAEVTAVVIGASFTAAPTEGEAPLTVQFTNTSVPVDAAVLWQFGDGAESSVTDPDHLYEEEGAYTVTLMVTSQGCTASAVTVILVTRGASGPSAVSVPNVFTPNGDGSNDQFRVTSTGLERFDLRIYNRYGQEMARLERPAQSWDGRTFAGEPASEGTYFFVLDARGLDGQEHKLHGTLTLLR